MKDSIVEIECLIFLLLLGFVVFVVGVVTAQRVRVTIKVVVEGKGDNRRCCYNINKGYGRQFALWQHKHGGREAICAVVLHSQGAREAIHALKAQTCGNWKIIVPKSTECCWDVNLILCCWEIGMDRLLQMYLALHCLAFGYRLTQYQLPMPIPLLSHISVFCAVIFALI